MEKTEDTKSGPIIPLTPGARIRARIEESRTERRDAEARLYSVEQERADLLRLVEKLDLRIEALEPICAELEEEEAKEADAIWTELAKCGIQECCYRLLLESPEPLDATLIRDGLQDAGIDMKHYANPLAVIHTSLKRIPDRVRSFKRKEQSFSGGMVLVRYYEAVRGK